MKNNKKAFTMIELVFVIVVLGILSAVAIPRFAATRTDAQVTKARADIASIRAGIINERQSRLFRGQSNFIATLDANNGQLFSAILSYPIVPSNSNGHWSQATARTYTFTVLGTGNNFLYCDVNTSAGCAGLNPGVFICTAGTSCGLLTN